MNYDIKDIKLSEKGLKRIEWAYQDMPVLKSIHKEFSKNKPLKNLTIGACLHVTSETANLMRVLKDGGASVSLCASNPLSTQDDVAASLVKDFKIPVFAKKGIDDKGYYKHIKSVLKTEPDITMDDGADLVTMLHKEFSQLSTKVIGGTEETTTGVIRLKSMEKNGILKYPIVAVNDSYTKYMFDNRYGTGQSTIDGILRATNRLLAGSTFVVAGYGWCGRGLAFKARGLGANVIVTEVAPVKALEALMDGFRVMKMDDACKKADFIVTLTGDINVVDEKHFKIMKNNCIVANSGHFDVEINKKALEKMTVKKREIRPFLVEHTFKDGRKVYLLAEGRLINLASAEGHPACVMDMSFANQALSVKYIKDNYTKLSKKVYKLPDHIDIDIARRKLNSMGVKFDKLTKEQEEYLKSWEEGT
ncbi:MAG: Adenosylhomocysteinase [candidate division TA06 bacterium 32_111]|uniref:Adenosylhomocysteinase n=2 Tax=Bacteria candidate phyla TaxID=1783234 RepID=A0A101I0Y0_UNCT6|nr:MAG: Adenosylhomocysteinase [candidate division TA06 bacterium 32_111]KUK86761.1 MAG: Adenosylhomocysteinase [candidate division TA06 bacterium 34_109]HAF08297.1 adenosylhomocysteinase [candidate division WOR-3 bacterium]HCP16551.1 adenosylhomocysteinase [candidate division WOR-3 bacterium]